MAFDLTIGGAYNAGVDSMAGWVHGDWNTGLRGNVSLLGLGIVGKGLHGGGTGAATNTTTVYRGANSSHVDFAAQSQGVVRPNNQWWQFWKGKGATPYQHNAVYKGTRKSPYTSWTTDLRVAENYSLRRGGTPGVIIRAEVPSSRLINSPNTKNINLLQGGGVVSESEVLMRGTVRGTIWNP